MPVSKMFSCRSPRLKDGDSIIAACCDLLLFPNVFLRIHGDEETFLFNTNVYAHREKSTFIRSGWVAYKGDQTNYQAVQKLVAKAGPALPL